MKQLLQSFGIGVLTILSLWLIAMFGATHQEGIFGTIGYVIAGIIDFPVILLYAAGGSNLPPLLVSIAIYLLEAIVVGLLVYLIFFARK